MAQYVFPKVENADIQRSRRDLSLYKPFTASCGTLCPVLSVDMLPGDWMRINTNATVQSLPMVAPVRGRWKCSFDYFYNPWSNIYGYMDNNTRQSVQAIIGSYRYVFKLGSGNASNTFLKAVKGATKVPRGGVFDFLGAPVGYFGKVTRTSANTSGGFAYNISATSHPAESLISYLDIVRNYYVNNQASNIPYVSAGGENSLYGYGYFSLEDMDNVIMKFRSNSNRSLSAAEDVNVVGSQYLTYLGWVFACHGVSASLTEYNSFKIFSQCGLFLRNYRMDLLRGIMNASVGTYNAKIDTTGDFVTMDQINFYSKLQMLINRIDITGGRFSDWIRTRWNVDAGIQVDRPIYLGSHSVWLNTIDVIATASGTNDVTSTENQSSSLGQQVGYQVGKMVVGSGKNRQRAVTVKSKQYGTLMCIFSIVPDVVYSQGFELNMLKTKFADIYDPAFKQIGFQDVLRGEMSAFPSIESDGSSISNFGANDLKDPVGKRVAWSEYMASLNRAHGDFAYGQSLDYWVNNRIYSDSDAPVTVGESGDSTSDISAFKDSSLARLVHKFDATTYVYPHLWNFPFADKNKQQMNYVVDAYFAIDANRSLGKRLMPHL